MAYVIEYGGQVPVSHLKSKERKFGWMVGLGCIAFLVAVQYMYPEALEGVRQLLIPGNDPVTVEAFQTMVEGLRDGGSLSDCVTLFCREVIYGAS